MDPAPAPHYQGRHIGPGGIKCPCCRPHASLKQSRIFLNRLGRRHAKQKLHALSSVFGFDQSEFTKFCESETADRNP